MLGPTSPQYRVYWVGQRRLGPGFLPVEPHQVPGTRESGGDRESFAQAPAAIRAQRSEEY
jgi:hypothetical protein